LAAEIVSEFDIEPELIRGSGGIFDVDLNGQRIFSKHDVGRFPENHEVIDSLAKLLQNA
jgi:selT/selW/selH-like putative selenoprotein